MTNITRDTGDNIDTKFELAYNVADQIDAPLYSVLYDDYHHPLSIEGYSWHYRILSHLQISLKSRRNEQKGL